MATKPLLMNGARLENGHIVNNRVDSDEEFEIYSLKNDAGFLYVFLNIERSSITNARQIYEIIYIHTLSGTMPAVIDKDYSRDIESKIHKEITELVGLNSVAGMKQLKELLVNEVINPLRSPEKYIKFKISIPNGILLYGPPGCGKTYTVTKLAEELGYNYIYVKGSDVSSPYIHGGVEKISRLFDRARSMAPTILFFDDFEALVPNRDSISNEGSHKQEEINQLLQEMNNIGEDNILVIGATNKPQIIDNAILRSGRFDKRILIPPPDKEARKELIRLYLQGRPVESSINYDLLADLTQNYVSSDIELIIEDSARMAIKNDLVQISEEVIKKCIAKNIPSITKQDIDYFNSLQESIDRF